MAQQLSKWRYRHNRYAYFPILKKKLRGGQDEQSRAKTVPTCCDRLDRNCVSTDNTELKYPQSTAYRECLNGEPYQRLY